MVPAVTSGPRIDPRKKWSWIIEICKVYLESTWCDEQNLEIVSKAEEMKFSTKFPQKMKFHENRGNFELKLSINTVIKLIRGVKNLFFDFEIRPSPSLAN
jgi:hypothetical protein